MPLSTEIYTRAARTGVFDSEAPVLTATGNRRQTGWGWRTEYRLAEPVVFNLGAGGSGLVLYVPRDYVTDGFSMPGVLLQMFQPSDPVYLLPAILHDWLYDAGLVPREMADLVLLCAMRAVGVPDWKRRAVYAAVRIGGQGGFGRPLPVNMDIVRAARANGVSIAIRQYLMTLAKEAPHV